MSELCWQKNGAGMLNERLNCSVACLKTVANVAARGVERQKKKPGIDRASIY